MNIFIVITILLSIWVLISLQSYRKLLIQIEKRLSPEEQRALKNNYEKLETSSKQLKNKIEIIDSELKASSERVKYLENQLTLVSDEKSKAKEKIEFCELEKESIQIDLISCRKIIKENQRIIKEKDSYILELAEDSKAQAEAVKFAVAKLNMHVPDAPKEPKKKISQNSSWAGNSGSSDWSTCKACGSTSTNLCRCSE